MNVQDMVGKICPKGLGVKMCDRFDCEIYTSKGFLVDAADDNFNIPVPDRHYIHDVIVVQGSTNLGTSATLTFTAPRRANEAILTLAAGTADNSASYPLRRQAAGSTGAAIAGTSEPVLIPSGGVQVAAGGTVQASGTATIMIISAPFPPAK